MINIKLNVEPTYPPLDPDVISLRNVDENDLPSQNFFLISKAKVLGLAFDRLRLFHKLLKDKVK